MQKFLGLLLVLALSSAAIRAQNLAKGQACLLDSQCGPNLACDYDESAIGASASHQCQNQVNQSCTVNGDCAKSVVCNSGTCGCKSGFFYDSIKKDCFPLQSAGQQCTSTSQCASGLVCSSTSDNGLQGRCLFDLGAPCASTDDCTNYLFCSPHGTCSCTIGTCPSCAAYDPMGHNCYVTNATSAINKYNLPCTSNSDCGAGAYCDNLPTGAQSGLCKVGEEIPCVSFGDCANGLTCGSDNLCECAPDQYFNKTLGDCQNDKFYSEPCIASDQCRDGLDCDVGSLSPPGAGSRNSFSCLKEMGSECSSSNDCVNALSCINNICACAASQFYDELLNDCFFKQKNLGSPCSDEDECAVGLACDMNPAGSASNTCLRVWGGKCSNSYQCVNNLACMGSKCSCMNGQRIDKHNQVCKSK